MVSLCGKITPRSHNRAIITRTITWLNCVGHACFDHDRETIEGITTSRLKFDGHLYPSVKKNLTGLFQNLPCIQLLIISFTLLLKFIPKQLNGFIWPWFSWSHHCIRPKTQMVIHCIRPKTQIVIQPIQVVILWSQTHQQNYKNSS